MMSAQYGTSLHNPIQKNGKPMLEPFQETTQGYAYSAIQQCELIVPLFDEASISFPVHWIDTTNGLIGCVL
jgi:hypothetical protein